MSASPPGALWEAWVDAVACHVADGFDRLDLLTAVDRSPSGEIEVVIHLLRRPVTGGLDEVWGHTILDGEAPVLESASLQVLSTKASKLPAAQRSRHFSMRHLISRARMHPAHRRRMQEGKVRGLLEFQHRSQMPWSLAAYAITTASPILPWGGR